MVNLEINDKELRQIQKDLDKLLPFDRGTKTIVRQAMRKAMKPVTKELKTLLNKNEDSGDLVKSIGVFDIKNRRSNNYGVQNTSFFGGRLYELAIYNNSVSDADRALIEADVIQRLSIS